MKLFFLHILSFVHSLSRLEPLEFEEFDQRKLNSKFRVFSRPFCSILFSMSHFRKLENSKVLCSIVVVHRRINCFSSYVYIFKSTRYP